MNTVEYISHLNERAWKILIPGKHKEIISVCFYIHPKGDFVQAWFAHFDNDGCINNPILNKYMAEEKTLETALKTLDWFLSQMEFNCGGGNNCNDNFRNTKCSKPSGLANHTCGD